jgi:hypothetical protein
VALINSSGKKAYILRHGFYLGDNRFACTLGEHTMNAEEGLSLSFGPYGLSRPPELKQTKGKGVARATTPNDH